MPVRPGPRELVLALCATALLIGSGFSQAQKKPAPKNDFPKAQAVLDKYCVPCHQGKDAPAGIALNGATSAKVGNEPDTWSRVAKAIESGIMPPKGSPTPTAAQRKLVGDSITAAIAGSCDVRNPGRVTMRRLTRLEYNNTVRDLTGLDLKLADDFPSDDVGYGFDNIGDVLSISPLLMEKYLHAAEVVANKAIVAPSMKPFQVDATHLQGERMTYGPEGEGVVFTSAEAGLEFDCTIPGEHRIRVTAYGQQAGPEPVKMDIRVDGQPVSPALEVKARKEKPGVYEATAKLQPGKHRIGALFLNDFYREGPPPLDRNLVLLSMEIIRPAGMPAELPPSHRRIIFERPTAANREQAARKILSSFATKAFRRPVDPSELDRLVQISDLAYKNGESFEQAMRIGVQAILSSPNFIFKVEQDNGKPQLGAYELASRLSYFLWSSMPDDQLMKLAADGELLKANVLEAQARRMLKSPKAAALGEAFASQWLNLRKLAQANPNPKQFPEFDEKMRQSMTTETRMFFDYVVAQDRPITDFLDGNYSFVNARLAKLYGISGPDGETFQKVSLAGTPRAGLLTQAAVLTLTSNPTRTSPVKRGKWVLEELLDQAPPPPPPGVPPLKEEDPNAPAPATFREQLKRHLKDEICASCHQRMDPIGLALENFDAVGKWRTADGQAPIDPSGELPDGSKFNGPVQLRAILLKKKTAFVECLARKMMTFATGRGMERADDCAVKDAAKRVEKEGYRFSSLVCAIVTSDPFRLRKVTK